MPPGINFFGLEFRLEGSGVLVFGWTSAQTNFKRRTDVALEANFGNGAGGHPIQVSACRPSWCKSCVSPPRLKRRPAMCDQDQHIDVLVLKREWKDKTTTKGCQAVAGSRTWAR
ncbi:hypothetical protein Ddc_16069 [Ditylenchus destructor]|nr:hypothetical protein Ddc_16069 [Ditylenchus destructor]